MPKAVPARYGIKAVVSVGAFLEDILSHAQFVKPTSAIEPALNESDFPDIQAQLCQALGPDYIQTDDGTDPKKLRRFAVIETVVRDEFCDLVAAVNLHSPDFSKIWNLFDILAILSDSEQCDPALLLWLVEELLDSQIIPGCEKVFDFLESRRERITAKHFKQKQLVILRTCNELLRRLSRALNPAFCGRVFIFMFQCFPLGDKSSVNLRGEYHVENVTTYDRDAVDVEDKMDVDVEAPGDGTQKSNGRRASSKAADSKKQPEKPLDPDALYPIFWSMQESFNQPRKLFDAKHFAAFKASLEATMDVFKTIKEPSRSKEKDRQSEENKRGLRKLREETDGELATSFNPKYLTSRDLFKLEISDLSFRRNILVQALIVMEFLLSLSADSKKKLIGIKAPNKSVTYPDQELSEEDTKWVTKMKHVIADYLKNGSDGAYFYRMIETVLSRDKNWVRWKIENCPSIEMPPLAPETFAEAKASASKLAATKKIRPAPMGSLDLSFLEEEDEEEAWAKIKDPKRWARPDLSTYKKKIADADFEIQMPTSAESKAAAIEKKATYTWLALRMAKETGKLRYFDKIDDDDNIDYIFEDHPLPLDDDEDSVVVAKANGDDAASLAADLSTIAIVDGTGGSTNIGKPALTDRLIETHPDQLARPLVHTTKEPGEGEADGDRRRFIDQQKFEMMRDGDEFATWTEDTGVAKTSIAAVTAEEKVPVLVVDKESAQLLKDMDFAARFVFIQPPPPGPLEGYLRASGKGLTEEQIKDVLKSTAELAYHASSSAGFYDEVVEYPESGDDEELFKALEKVVLGAAALEKAVEDVDMGDAGDV